LEQAYGGSTTVVVFFLNLFYGKQWLEFCREYFTSFYWFYAVDHCINSVVIVSCVSSHILLVIYRRYRNAVLLLYYYYYYYK